MTVQLQIASVDLERDCSTTSLEGCSSAEPSIYWRPRSTSVLWWICCLMHSQLFVFSSSSCSKVCQLHMIISVLFRCYRKEETQRRTDSFTLTKHTHICPSPDIRPVPSHHQHFWTNPGWTKRRLHAGTCDFGPFPHIRLQNENLVQRTQIHTRTHRVWPHC